MKKNYTYHLLLICIALFTTSTFNAYSKSNSIIGINNPLYELKSQFFKILVDDRFEKKLERNQSKFRNIINCPTFEITASSIDICQNESVTFTPDPSGGGTYEWFVQGISQGSSPTFTTASLSNGDIITAELTSNLSTCGTVVASDNDITMTVNTTATVSFDISGPSAICSGVNTTYSLVNGIPGIANGGTNPGLQWFVNGNAISGETGATYTTSTLTSGDVISLQVTSNVRCADPVPAISENTITISINPDASISPAIIDQSACINVAITPIEFAVGGGATGASVTGLPTGVTGSFSGGILTISGTPTGSGGTFSYTVTTTGTCAQTTAGGAITVTPNATISLTSASSNASACEGATITDITYAVGASGTNATVSGLPSGISGSYSSGVFTISGSTTTVGSFPFTVTATGPCGPATTDGTITINQNLTPSVNISSSDADNIICSGDSVTFTAMPTNGGSSPSYIWQINGSGNFGTNSTFTTTALTTGQTVTVILTSSETCVTSATATSSSITTTVIPIVTPTVSIAITTGSNPTCNGSSVTFTATPMNGGTPSYQWQVNNTNVSGANSSTFTTSTLSNTNTVKVIMTANALCATSPTATSNVINMTVTPILTPSVTIVSNDPNADNNICSTATVLFTATPTNGGSSPSYQWQVNGSNVGSNLPTYSNNALNTGDIVTVIMTSNYPCTTSATSTSNSLAHTRFTPLTTETITGPNGICPANTNVVYSVPIDANVLSYNWVVPAGFIINSGQGTRSISLSFTTPSTGNNNISVTRSNPCTASQTTTLTVNVQNFAAVNAGSDQYVCVGTPSIKLAGSISGAVGGNGPRKWDWSYSAGSISNSQMGDLNATYNLPNNPPAGSSYTVTISTNTNVAGCTGTQTDQMVVYVLPNPTASISVSGTNPICAGNTSQVTFGATGYPNLPMVLTYNINGATPNQTINLTTNGSGVATAALTTAALNANTTYNLVSIKYAVNALENECVKPASGSATITVNPNHTISPATTDQTACINSAITPINFTVGGGGGGATASGLPTGVTGNYNNVSGVFTISGTPTVSGSYPYTVTTAIGNGCTRATASGTLTVNPAATVDAGLDQIICSNGTAVMAADFGGAATSATWSSPTGGSFSNNSTTAIYTPSATDKANGTVTLTYTTIDPAGPCGAVSDTVLLTINALPTVNAGVDQTICAGSPASMAATFGGSASSATWTTSGTGAFNNNNLNAVYTPSTADISSGSVNLTYTTNDPDGPCNEAVDFLVLTINPIPTVDAGVNQTICAGSTATMAATLGGGATPGSWSSPTGGTFSSNAINAIYTPSAADITSGSVTLTYTTNDPTGPCVPANDTLLLTINPQATVDVGADQTICSNQTASVVAALSSGASGTWSTSGTGGFNNNAAASTTYNPTPADIATGSVNLMFTTNNPVSPCTAINDVLTLTIKKQVVITTQPQNTGVCVSNPASFSVVAVGDNLTYQWYKVNSPSDSALTNGSGISGVNTATLNFASTTMAHIGSYYVVISGNAACSSVQSLTRTLNVNSVINITSQPADQELCVGNNASFTVVSTGSTPTYQWYKVGSPNVALSNGSGITGATTATLNIVSIDPVNAGGYYVIITGAGGTCPNVTSATANLTVTQPPTVTTFSYAGSPICSDSGAQTVILEGTNAFTGGTYSATPSGLNIDSMGTITPSVDTAGTYTVTYTIPASGGCPSGTATTSVTITAKPIASITYSAAAYCKSDTNPHAVTLSGSNNTLGTYSAPAGLTMNSSGTITPNTSTVGTYTVSYTIPASGGCAQVIANATVTIDAAPVATFSYGDTTQFCKTGGTATPTGFTSGGSFTSTAGLSLNATSGAINLGASTAGTYTVTHTIPASAGCVQVQASQTINIFNDSIGGTITGYVNNAPSLISNNIIACHQGSGTLTLAGGYSGSILRWESSTNGGTTWTPISNTTNNTYTFSNITITTIFRAVLQSGPCSLGYSAIAFVNVIPPNIKPTVSPSGLQTICFGGSVTYTSTSGYGTGQFLQGGDFQTGQLNTQDPNGWLVDGSPGGYTASADNENPNHWAGVASQNNTFYGITYNSGDPKFAMANGPLTTTLQTPIINTFGLTDFTFGFDQAYSIQAGAQILVQLSLDGGATYNINLQNITGPASSALFNTFAADNTTFDLQNYIGQANLRVKFTFIGVGNSAWALDNFIFPSAPVNESLEWVNLAGTVLSTNVTYGYTPPLPGLNTVGVTSLINGCRSVAPLGITYVNVAANYAYAGQNIAPIVGECGVTTVTLNAYDNTKTAAKNIENGAYSNSSTTVNFNLPGTGVGGTWSVDAAPATCSGTPSFSSTTNPTNPNIDPRATFTGEAGTYTLRWTVGDCSSTVQVTLQECQTVDFDGVDDYATFGNAFNRTGAFSIEAWVKPNSITGTQTILSKRNGFAIGNGYDLSLNGSTVSFKWDNAAITSSPYQLTTDRWYHLAVTFGGGTYRLYIDGIQVNTVNGASAPTDNTLKFLLGAMDQTGNPPNKPVKHFKGWIDEVRLWNKTITQEQIRQMMNQEIKTSTIVAGNIEGEIVPLDVAGRFWADLDGYYKMNIGCGALVPTAGTIAGKLRNIYTAEPQTAPLPYTSNTLVNDQNWETDNTWTNFPVWDVPNSVGIDDITRIDWNIVRTNRNIVSNNRDVTLLGLLVDSNDLTITDTAVTQNENNDGTGLLITHYLKIDGKIDLVGQSQLVQKRYYYDHDGNPNTPEITNQISESFFDSTSAGFIERDQQGTGNKWNYNYWGSPVAPGNASVDINNLSTNSYTIEGVLRDGTMSASPQNIAWTGGYDGAPGPPITLSTFWLYKYSAASNTYANWAYVGNSGSMNIGLGYSMKGSAADGGRFDGTTQNYVFVGKPNNGTILNSIPAGNDVLVGNPYPSAIDANAFINDNAGSINGALYFWEHDLANNTHVLRSYIGGYAIYNLVGGNPAVIPPITTDFVLIAGGNGTRRPERYVPVGQGFFVTASASGGDIEFKNSQRVFKREAFTGAANDGSLFFRTAGSVADADTNTDEDLIKRIRLTFNSPEGAIRPLLLGFTPNNAATDGVDYGYDALNTDAFPSDLLWMIDGAGYVIQGVGAFDNTKKYPFAMNLAINGEIKISLTDLENFDDTIDVFVFDSVLGTYHQINTTEFTMTLEAGNYDNRFFLTFTNGVNLSIDETDVDNVLVNYLLDTDEIYIKPPTGVQVKQVYLINIIGQTVKSWNMTNMPMLDEIRIPTKNISEGTYIIKVETDGATINKKVIIKY